MSLTAEKDVRKVDFPEDSPTAVCMVLEAINSEDWGGVSRLMISKRIRPKLQWMFGVLLSRAFINGSVGKLLEAMPKKLKTEEGLSAFVFLYDIKDLEVTRLILDKGGRPAPKVFANICDDYVSRIETPFEYEVIKRCVENEDYDWREALNINLLADYYDVLNHSKTAYKPVFSMIAYILMPNEVKLNQFRKMESVEQFYFVLKHGIISGSMMEVISLDLRSKLLLEGLGL